MISVRTGQRKTVSNKKTINVTVNHKEKDKNRNKRQDKSTDIGSLYGGDKIFIGKVKEIND